MPINWILWHKPQQEQRTQKEQDRMTTGNKR